MQQYSARKKERARKILTFSAVKLVRTSRGCWLIPIGVLLHARIYTRTQMWTKCVTLRVTAQHLTKFYVASVSLDTLNLTYTLFGLPRRISITANNKIIYNRLIRSDKRHKFVQNRRYNRLHLIVRRLAAVKDLLTYCTYVSTCWIFCRNRFVR